MSIREYEAAMIVPPLENSAGMKSQANVVVSNAGVVVGLSGLFGGSLGQGHFLTIAADGGKLYVKFAPNAAGSIDAFATGNDATIAYPIPDGAEKSFVPIAGRETGTGVATLCVYNQLHIRVASGGVATAFARLHRSSLAPGQDAGEFRAP